MMAEVTPNPGDIVEEIAEKAEVEEAARQPAAAERIEEPA